jgi:hypothetical protein
LSPVQCCSLTEPLLCDVVKVYMKLNHYCIFDSGCVDQHVQFQVNSRSTC